MPQIEFDLKQRASETISEYARRFFQALKATGKFYRSSTGLLYISGDEARELITAAEALPRLNSALAPYRELTGEGGSSFKAYARFTEAWFKGIMEHDARCHLNLVEAVLRDPAVFKLGGQWQLSTAGYNRGDDISFYQLPSAIEPRPGVEHLRKCFSGVPFADEKYRANLVGFLLSLIVIDRALDTPLLVIEGNRQGLGKSSAVAAIGTIVARREPQPIEGAGSEFAKQLGARFLEKERLISIDNVVRHGNRAFDNQLLSSLLTAGYSKAVRLLGASRSITGAGVAFAMSINDARLSADLATRSINVHLERERPAPMTPYCRSYAVEHREEIYGELLNLALSPATSAPQDIPDTFRFRAWAEFIAPRVTPSFGPLAFEAIRRLDADGIEVGNFLLDQEDEFTTADFVRKVLHSDSYPALRQRILSTPSDHGRNIVMGRMLSRFLGNVIETDGGRVLLHKVRDGVWKKENA